MAIPLFGEIERLINEHGSAVILKERIELLKEQYSALEKRLSLSESEKTQVLADKQAIELAHYKLKDRVASLETQLAERHGAKLDPLQETLLCMLAAFNSYVHTAKAAGLANIGHQLALYQLTEMERAGLVHGRYEIGGESPSWEIAQDGRAYLVRHGLLT